LFVVISSLSKLKIPFIRQSIRFSTYNGMKTDVRSVSIGIKILLVNIVDVFGTRRANFEKKRKEKKNGFLREIFEGESRRIERA